MQPQKVSGIIIGIKPHKEFDRAFLVFSHKYGILHVVAKGVRKVPSRRGFHIDLFNYVKMEIEKSARHILYLREISTVNIFKKMRKQPMSFAAANIIASFLTHNIPPEFPQKKLFILTRKTFETLDKIDKDPGQILFVYLLKTMHILGYLPERIPKKHLRATLRKSLENLNPQLTLTARRTLGIFSRLKSMRSN